MQVTQERTDHPPLRYDLAPSDQEDRATSLHLLTCDGLTVCNINRKQPTPHPRPWAKTSDYQSKIT